MSLSLDGTGGVDLFELEALRTTFPGRKLVWDKCVRARKQRLQASGTGLRIPGIQMYSRCRDIEKHTPHTVPSPCRW